MPEALMIAAWAVLAVFSVRFVVGHFIDDMGGDLDGSEVAVAGIFGLLAAMMAPLYIVVILYHVARYAFKILPGNQSIAKWVRWFFILDRDERKKFMNAN